VPAFPEVQMIAHKATDAAPAVMQQFIGSRPAGRMSSYARNKEPLFFRVLGLLLLLSYYLIVVKRRRFKWRL